MWFYKLKKIKTSTKIHKRIFWKRIAKIASARLFELLTKY